MPSLGALTDFSIAKKKMSRLYVLMAETSLHTLLGRLAGSDCRTEVMKCQNLSEKRECVHFCENWKPALLIEPLLSKLFDSG